MVEKKNVHVCGNKQQQKTLVMTTVVASVLLIDSLGQIVLIVSNKFISISPSFIMSEYIHL